MVIAIVLLLVGFAFVLAEVFFPSLGAFGIVAGTCATLGTMEAFAYHPAAGWMFVAAIVIGTPLIIVGSFRLLPHTKIGKRMVLAGPVTPAGSGVPALDHLVGQTGHALTDLRPAGTARLGGERVSVVSLGGLIEKGAGIAVVSVEGTEVRVRADERAS